MTDVVISPDQWVIVTDFVAQSSGKWEVLSFGLGLVVFLLAVIAVGSFRR